jgi:hypothetical protein
MNMQSSTIAGNQRNFAGELVGTLRIGQIVGRRGGSPLWSAVCTRCLSEQTLEHADLINSTASCRASICGRENVRAASEESPSTYRRRIAESEAKHRREIEAAEAKKLADAEAAYKTTTRQIGETIRQRITTMPDDEAYQDPATAGVRMTPQQATDFNDEQAALFVAQNPTYYACAENLKALNSYLSLNHINKIVSTVTLQHAYDRLRSFGLIQERPAPTPTPPTAPPVKVNLSIDRTPAPNGPRIHSGVGEDGRPRNYTDGEVERMSSREFRKFFQLNPPSLDTARAWGR